MSLTPQQIAVSRIAVLVAVCCCGCIERRLTIRSDPPGALVTMSGGKLGTPADEHELGVTPVSVSYVHNGSRRITLVDPQGEYETLTVYERLRPRWYEVFPIEFVTENLVPFRIRDHRVLHYPMQRRSITATDPLLRRAEGLRSQAGSEAF